jgi:hypothetical protein
MSVNALYQKKTVFKVTSNTFCQPLWKKLNLDTHKKLTTIVKAYHNNQTAMVNV